MGQRDRSEIDGEALLLPIAIAHRFGAVATAQFRGQGGGGCGAARRSLGQGTLGGGGQVGRDGRVGRDGLIGIGHLGFLGFAASLI